MKKYSLYITLCFTFLFVSFGCSKSENEIPFEIEVQDFIWKGLNAYYLWQSDINDLQDTRFNNQAELNNYLSGFPVPENLFENLLNRPEDRFSIMVNDYNVLEKSFQGITLSSGMEFGVVKFLNGSSSVFGYVRYVVPNSPADVAGITRGMLFTAIDGVELTEDNFRNLLFGNNTRFTIGFSDYNNGNPVLNGNSIPVDKEQITENPIAISKVINNGRDKVGYLLYNQFASSYDNQLNDVFANFKSENIDDLIIDLRYNPGGFVSSATYLGGMVTGQFNGEIFSQEIWNSKVRNAFPSARFENNFTNIIDTSPINSLGLTRVYFIVSGSTASASELVINSLSSYIDVYLIGTQTVGKQQGSITLYDSDNLQKTGSNLNTNHTYALQPIVLEISNKDEENEPLGFIPGSTLPGVNLSENYGNMGVLGERSDPLLDRTLIYIETGSKGILKNSVTDNKEIFSSKLATPTRDNMYVELKK